MPTLGQQPRRCEEDIFTTRNGVRLKENLCPVNKTSGSNVIDDLGNGPAVEGCTA